MNQPREAVYAALFNLIKGATGITNSSRKFLPWDSITPEQCPYLMQVEQNETAEVNGRGIPIKWLLHVEQVVYIATSGDVDGQVPTQIMNPLIDAIEAAMGDPVLAPQTLGGLVSQVRIKGVVEKGQDRLGARGWVVVPVEIVIPA